MSPPPLRLSTSSYVQHYRVRVPCRMFLVEPPSRPPSFSFSTCTETCLMLPRRALSARSLVPGHVRARFVLLLCGGRVLPAQSELWNHPQTGVSWPSDRGQLHEKIRQGDASAAATNTHTEQEYVEVSHSDSGFTSSFCSLQTIGTVLLSYADIIAKEFPNHVKKEKVVSWEQNMVGKNSISPT